MKKTLEYLVSTAIGSIVRLAESSEKLTHFLKGRYSGYLYLSILIHLFFQIIDLIFSFELGVHVYHMRHDLHLTESVSLQSLSEALFVFFEMDVETINNGKQTIGQKIRVKKMSLKSSFHKLPRRMLYIYIALTVISFITTGAVPMRLIFKNLIYVSKEYAIQELAHSQLGTIDKMMRKVKQFIENLFDK